MYNANRDRSVNMRKSLQELHRELSSWEARMSKPKKSKASIEDVASYQVRILLTYIQQVKC